MWIQNAIPDDGIISTSEGINDVNSKIIKGLYFVYVYGIYEAIIQRIVQRTIDIINSNSIKIGECQFGLFPIIFSKEYDSLYSAGRDKVWNKRWKISNRLIEDDIVSIPADVFPTDGKNIRYSQLESIANSFGLVGDILPRPEVGGYIQDMVNNRNYIAHGDYLPKDIGARYTKNDLILHCDIILEVCTHLINQYSSYVMDCAYKK